MHIQIELTVDEVRALDDMCGMAQATALNNGEKWPPSTVYHDAWIKLQIAKKNLIDQAGGRVPPGLYRVETHSEAEKGAPSAQG
jgi:hypothetical protein